jgi:hypothetical protein
VLYIKGAGWSAAPALEPEGSYELRATFYYTNMEMEPGSWYDVTMFSFLTAWYDLVTWLY